MKVICDVCGTTFSETEANCPICGCAAVLPAKAVTDDGSFDVQQNSTANAYAKGGRFAKSNVKQRNARGRSSEGRFSGEKGHRKEEQQGNKGLIAVVVILLLAIIMVVVYIGVNVLFKDMDNNTDSGNQTTGSQQQNVGGDQSIACTSIVLNRKVQEFTAATDQLLLDVIKTPEDATDVVEFESSDPEIATVNENGLVQPGTKQGQAIITVTCGNATEQCTIISYVGEEPVTSEPPTQGVTLPDGFVLKLKTYQDSGEITVSNTWPTAVIYTETNGIKASDITWTTSDPSVAIVENGKVIGVDRGTCTITAAIGDQTASCKVISAVDPVPETPYELSDEDGDMTIAVGQTVTLNLRDKETGANVQDIEWLVSHEGYVEIDGNKITGVKAGTIDVYVEYEEVTYKCIVRITASET